MSKPDEASARQPRLNYKPRRDSNPDDERRILAFLARKVDFSQETSADQLGRLLSAEAPTPIELPGGTVEFPALDELIAAYIHRYPRQIYAYNVGRPILEAMLDAKTAHGEKSIGAKIYFGIYPEFEKTLQFFPWLVWKLIYWLQRLLPAEVQPYPSREPRQLIFFALGPDGQPITLSERAASESAIPATKGTISGSPGPAMRAFIPNITMGDGATRGGEMTNTCPPN